MSEHGASRISWISAVIHDGASSALFKPLHRVTLEPQTCNTEATKRELPNTDHHCGPSTAPLTICYIIGCYRRLSTGRRDTRGRAALGCTARRSSGSGPYPGRRTGMAPHGITVNAYCPGIVDTQMWVEVDRDLGAINKVGEASHEGQAAGITLGRVSTGGDVAALVSYLAGPTPTT